MPSTDPSYLLYRTGSAVSRALPERAVAPFSAAVGRLAARVMDSRRMVVERNLRRVLGDDLSDEALRAGVDATFGSYARYWVESFRLPGTPGEELDAGIRTIGLEHISAGLDAGHGVICSMPHLGGWEWAAFWMTEVLGYPVSAVVEQIEPPELAAWFVELRERLGMEIIALDSHAATRCARALAGNRVLTLMSDRDVSGGGVEVEFFGERTTLPGGPATLALRTGAALVPAAVYHDLDGRHLGIALPAIDTSRQGRLREDVTRVTQDLARALEDLIRRAPDQWHLLQPNWPSDHAALAAASE